MSIKQDHFIHFVRSIVLTWYRINISKYKTVYNYINDNFMKKLASEKKLINNKIVKMAENIL